MSNFKLRILTSKFLLCKIKLYTDKNVCATGFSIPLSQTPVWERKKVLIVTQNLFQGLYEENEKLYTDKSRRALLYVCASVFRSFW